MTIDETHRAGLKSWVESANQGSDFPIQNLPLGVIVDGGVRRAGVAIGDRVLDLKALAGRDLLKDAAREAAQAASGDGSNAMLALGAGPRRALRRQLSILLSDGAYRTAIQPLLRALDDVELAMPAAIGDYTDFFAGIHHARSAGRIMRPGGELPPNYKHVPIGYHGRASSVRPSGAEVRRPNGQVFSAADSHPMYQACARLDFELELGIWIGPGNAAGAQIPIDAASDHIAGFCLLNDWSARDIQVWEAQPLGPFLAKNFATTISPWIITPEALAPFRLPQPPRPDGDPEPLPYLLDATDQAQGALNLELSVYLQTQTMRDKGIAAAPISRSAARHLYWTPAQLVAHHTVGGCDLRPGDLLGTGTISGTDRGSAGAILEITEGGQIPIVLPNGEQRRFLEDGDEISFSATARRQGFVSLGFGPCRGLVLPARTAAHAPRTIALA